MTTALKTLWYVFFWVGVLLWWGYDDTSRSSPANASFLIGSLTWRAALFIVWGLWALVSIFCLRDMTVSRRANASEQLRQGQNQQSNTTGQTTYKAIRQYDSDARELRERELERLWREWITHAESYFEMDGRQFEDAIADLFRKRGYEVRQTSYSGDSGIDAIALKDGKKYFIQCKRYAQDRQISGPDMQQFIGAVTTGGNADGAFYVTTAGFTPAALTYAKQSKVEPIGKAQLIALHHDAYPDVKELSVAAVMCHECGSNVSLPLEVEPSSGHCPNGHSITSNISKRDLRIFSSTPICKKCGARMRTSRRGRYWKCTNTRCYYTERVPNVGMQEYGGKTF